MINMLRALMENDKKQTNKQTQEYIHIVRREIEVLKKNKIEMLEIKIPIMEMKNIFDEPISRLSSAKGKNL